MSSTSSVGTIGWVDLTVPNAPEVCDFYKAVVGWSTSEVAMGDYSDFCMHPAADAPPVAGVCHARGHNVCLPPQWLIYLTVADLDVSIVRVQELAGKLLVGPKNMGGTARFCVIEDPAGAVAALYCAGKS